MNEHTLTTAGERRRRAMRGELLATMDRHHRRRRRTRRLAGTTGLVLLGAIVAALALPLLDSPMEPRRVEVRPMSAVRIEVVANDPGVLGRYAIDDGALIDHLVRIGRPSGLIIRNGDVMLTNAVTDAELEAQRSPPSSL